MEKKTAEANSEKLEKAQQVDEEPCKLLPPGAEYMDPPDGGDVTPLEGVRRMVVDYRQRIAELESRTVKLPEPFELAKSSSGLTYYYADEVDAALTAAGIKVEVEVMFKIESSEQRLKRVLTENAGKFTIDKTAGSIPTGSIPKYRQLCAGTLGGAQQN